jgi:hypothetical protein
VWSSYSYPFIIIVVQSLSEWNEVYRSWPHNKQTTNFFVGSGKVNYRYLLSISFCITTIWMVLKNSVVMVDRIKTLKLLLDDPCTKKETILHIEQFTRLKSMLSSIIPSKKTRARGVEFATKMKSISIFMYTVVMTRGQHNAQYRPDGQKKRLGSTMKAPPGGDSSTVPIGMYSMQCTTCILYTMCISYYLQYAYC